MLMSIVTWRQVMLMGIVEEKNGSRNYKKIIIDLYKTQPKRPQGSLFIWREHECLFEFKTE